MDVLQNPPSQTRLRRWRSSSKIAAVAAVATVSLVACTPRVIVEAPSDPITINLNVKIDQEVRVKLDKEVEDLIADNPDLF